MRVEFYLVCLLAAKVFKFWLHLGGEDLKIELKERTKMMTSSLAATASCPSGDQRRQSRTFGRSLNLTSRSIFRNGFKGGGIRGLTEGVMGGGWVNGWQRMTVQGRRSCRMVGIRIRTFFFPVPPLTSVLLLRFHF